MKKSNTTTVIEKLIDLELFYKLKVDLTRFKRKQLELNKACPDKAA